jgi:hypothetical protein
MARTRVLLGVGVAAAVLVAVGGAVHGARQASVGSAVSAVSKQVLELLPGYHSKHGRYPTALSELQLNFLAADGASEETLRFVRYASDGASFTYAEVGPDEWHRRVWWCHGRDHCGFADLR